MVSFSGQPKRDYLGSMRQRNWSGFTSKFGRGLKSVGKEFTRPGVSVRQVMAPFGRKYRQYGSHLSEPSGKVARWFSTAKVSEKRRKTMEQRIKNLGPTVVESAATRDVVIEELDPMEEKMVKNIGKYRAKKIMDRVRTLFRPGSGMHVKKERITQEIRAVSGVDKESKESSVADAESFAPDFETARDRGATQPEVAEEMQEAVKLGILSEQEVKAGEKSLGAEYFEKTGATFQERHRPESFGETVGKRFGWGRRSNNDNK